MARDETSPSQCGGGQGRASSWPVLQPPHSRRDSREPVRSAATPRVRNGPGPPSRRPPIRLAALRVPEEAGHRSSVEAAIPGFRQGRHAAAQGPELPPERTLRAAPGGREAAAARTGNRRSGPSCRSALVPAGRQPVGRDDASVRARQRIDPGDLLVAQDDLRRGEIARQTRSVKRRCVRPAPFCRLADGLGRGAGTDALSGLRQEPQSFARGGRDEVAARSIEEVSDRPAGRGAVGQDQDHRAVASGMDRRARKLRR